MTAPRPDRLREVLERATREELLQVASVAHGLPDPKDDWKDHSPADLADVIAAELGYQGSSSVAWLWRKVTRGRERAGVRYEEVVDDLISATHLNAGLVRRFGEDIGDHLYARELLLTLLLTLAHPDAPKGSTEAGKPIADLLATGLKAVKAVDFLPYASVLQVAQTLLRATTGKDLTGAALNAVFSRRLASILGPVGAGLFALTLGKTVASLQGPNLERCAMAVAAIGSLRMKYFPLPEEKVRAMEAFIASLERDCRECGKKLDGPHEPCLICWAPVHEACGTSAQRLDTGQEGRVCTDCRKKDLEGEGLLLPNPGSLVTPRDWVQALGYRAQVFNNRLDQSQKELQASLTALSENVQRVRTDVADDLRKLLRSAFGYLYVMFFTTVFLTLFGLAYFKAAEESPDSHFNPGMFFRLSMIVMIAVPLAIWIVGALWRASRNAKREDYEKRPDGRRLGFKDYAFGYLYYDHPIENIWGPITLIGATIAVVMYLFLFG